MELNGDKKHGYLLAVVAAAFILYALFFHARLFGEINGSFISYGFVMDEAYANGMQPHWTPLLSGGYPLFSNPEVPGFGILNLMIFLLHDVILAFSITILLHSAIAGIGAALLAFEFTQSRHAAALSGILFIISGSFAYALFSGTMPFLFPLAFLPWTILFSYRASKSKPLVNIPIAAAFLALQLLSGGTIYFFWTLLGMALFLAAFAFFQLLKLKTKKVAATGIIAAIIVAFSLGFAAVKLLPGIEFIDLTNRAEGVDYESFVWRFTQVKLSELPAALTVKESIAKVGLLALLLSLVGFACNIRKKFAIAFALMAAVAILVEVDTFLTKLFFHLPGFGQTRQIYNVFALLSLSLAVMAGAGWAKLLGKVKKYRVMATAAVVVLIAAELFLVSPKPEMQPWEKSFEEQLQQNYLLQNVSNDSSLFRLHLYGEDFVGLSLAKYAVPLGIRMLDWTTGNVWFNDHVQYTTISGQLNSARLWGMANVKYIASRQPLNLTGFEFVGEFKECSICDLKASYLYRNSEFLPAAFVAKNITLIAGDSKNNFQNTYAIVHDSSYDVRKAAVVNSDNVPPLEGYGLVIVASGPISPEDEARLRQYSDAGGKLEPQVFDSENQVDYAVISSFFSDSLPVVEADVEEYKPNKVVIKAPASGLLVVSEKFHKFNGWKAYVNGMEAEKLNANIIATGVFVSENDTVLFEYKPSSYRLGMLITLLTVAVAIALPFAGRKILKKSHNHSNKNA